MKDLEVNGTPYLIKIKAKYVYEVIDKRTNSVVKDSYDVLYTEKEDCLEDAKNDVELLTIEGDNNEAY